jgi:hypothetical protein
MTLTGAVIRTLTVLRRGAANLMAAPRICIFMRRCSRPARQQTLVTVNIGSILLKNSMRRFSGKMSNRVFQQNRPTADGRRTKSAAT